VNGPPEGDARRWQRVERLFQEASALDDDAAVDAFLERHCGGDRELREEVESLLEQSEGAEGFLRGMARRMGLPFGGEPERVDLSGRSLGAWTLRSRIGQGGMGVVYLAERADGAFEKQVAVKILPGATAFGSERERFARERRLLACLDHPGIARLLDGGITPEGLPFLVMEYVEGEPIDRFCDRHLLTVRERVELFRKACEAVEYAHRNLIIHRDLKPANILVTPDGSVKLLDFGIARVVEGEGDEGELAGITRLSGRPLTPSFASPEQISGGPLTTTSDVYALGVLLYGLLAGSAPYELAGATPGEAERIVCHTDPPTPSGVISGPGEGADDPEEVARLRRTTPGRLRRTLGGDLDTVVLTAMAKEPERRYASAAALSEDLGRFLDEHPILARRAGLGYRLRKFVSRRPGLAAAGLAALFAVVGYGVTLNLHAQRLEVERNNAQVEAELRGQVSDFLFAIFEGASPRLGGSEDLTARELLDRGAENLDDFDGDPLFSVELAATLGRVYGLIGRFEDATHHLERSLDLRAEHGLDEPVEVAAALSALGEHYTALGEAERALEARERALALRREALGERHELVAASLAAIGNHHSRSGDLDQAEEVMQRALDLQVEILGDDHPDVLISLAALGRLAWRRGELDRAVEFYGTAWDRWEGGDEPDASVGTSLANNLGVMYRELGRYEESRTMYENALAVRRELFGDRHPTVATTLHNLSVVLRRMGELDAAEAAGREALEQRMEFHGEADALVAQSLNSLGNLLRARGNWEEAAELLSRTLDIYDELGGRGTPTWGVALNNLANALRDGGETVRAEAKYLEAIEITRSQQGPTHPGLAATLYQLGLLYRLEGRLADAEAALRESLEIREAIFDEDHPDRVRTAEELARVLEMAGG